MRDQDLTQSVVRVEDLVDYQKDSVVSRTMVNKEKGSVTLFAFDDGQQLSEHTSPFDAILLNIEGSLAVTINSKSFMVEDEQIVQLPANQPHSVRALTPAKMLLIMIKE